MAVNLTPATAFELAAGYVKSFEDGVWRAADRSAERAFAYSDGDEVEDYLLAVMRRASDLSAGSEELESQIRDFPTRYHLSGNRTFLLRPVADLLDGRVLEIGAGCGAITRFLGERAAEVVAVEGSSRRAAIAAARCRDLPNVAVVGERFGDLQPLGLFDAVTLIGVLEYARAFAAPGDADPVAALLARARAFLKPGGSLLLAIENQLGLKYFAMYPEDHLGEPMAGIENRYGPRSAVTFGRKMLHGLLADAGLGEQRWLFPFPDYKFPSLVLSEAGASAQAGDGFAWAIAQTACRDPQQPAHASFALQRAWPTVLRNGLVPDLANSFLVVASDEPVARDERVLATYFGGSRRRALQKETRFVREADHVWVRRARAYPDAPQTLPWLGFTLSDEPLLCGRVLEEDLIAATGREGWEIADWVALLAPWFAVLRERFDLPAQLEPGILLPARAMDAVPRNLVVLPDGSAQFIDQEWQPHGDVSLGYIFFRALFSSLLSVEQCAAPIPEQGGVLLTLVRAGFDALGWELSDDALRDHVERERVFQGAVNGTPYLDFDQIAALSLRIRPDFAAERATVTALEREREALWAERASSQAAELERRVALETLYREELEEVQSRIDDVQARLDAASEANVRLHDGTRELQDRLDAANAANERLYDGLIARVQLETERLRHDASRTETLIAEIYGSKWWSLKRLAGGLRRRARSSPR